MDESWPSPAITPPYAGGSRGLSGARVPRPSGQSPEHKSREALDPESLSFWGSVGMWGGLRSERLLWEAVEKPGLSPPATHSHNPRRLLGITPPLGPA